MDDKSIRALQRRNDRRLSRFLKRLRATNRPWQFADPLWSGHWQAAAPGAAFRAFGKVGVFQAGMAAGRVRASGAAVWASVQDLGAALVRLVLGLLRWPWRRIAQGGGAMAAAASALAASQVYMGYRDHPAADWHQRLQERLGSAIFSSDRQLQGTIFPAVLPGSAVDPADYGYIRVEGELPTVWRQGVLALEQNTLFDSWRSVCGFDLLATIKRLVTDQGGGSGLAQQNAKNLMEPQFKRRASGLGALLDKFYEAGAACSLHSAEGGAEGMLQLYAAYAPVAQVGGVTRGIEAGAWVFFNSAPRDLQPFQQSLLVALAQHPLSLTPPSSFKKGCAVLRDTPHKALDSDERKAARQCRVIARARVALRKLMPQGPELDAQVDQLNALEATGIVPANPFDPLPTKRLVNLSSRTRAALSPAMVERVAEEADALDVPAGTPLTLTMAQPAQFAFGKTVRDALQQIDASTAGRENLCVPLAYASPLRHCPGTPQDAARADVVLVRMSVDNGGITRLFESSRIAFGAANTVGSVGKMVIALVAAQHGYAAGTKVCPRQARDGSKLLRRVTQPEFGFKQCRPDQLITFEEAMAKSDNLAAYEVARALPRDALRRGIEALGLEPDADPKANLAYTLAFGTQAGTPAQLLTLGQALFGVAFGVPARSGGPRVLASNLKEAPAYTQVLALLPQAQQRLELRQLLQAPVHHPKGTLHHLQGPLLAGKTGTTSSGYGPRPGVRPYVQAKYTLAYSPADRTVALAIINAPAGHALGLHSMPGEMLAPAMSALLQ